MIHFPDKLTNEKAVIGKMNFFMKLSLTNNNNLPELIQNYIKTRILYHTRRSKRLNKIRNLIKVNKTFRIFFYS